MQAHQDDWRDIGAGHMTPQNLARLVARRPSLEGQLWDFVLPFVLHALTAAIAPEMFARARRR